MTARDHLTGAALIGTRQQPFTPPRTGTPLDELLQRLDDREPAQRLLDATALLVGYEQAGAMPAEPPQSTPPAPEDPRPRAPVRHLSVVLREQPSLLPEWLALANEAGKRVPEEWAPNLMNIAASQGPLQPAVRKAVGHLGEWLARLQPGWEWMLPPEPDEVIWETGHVHARAAVLRRMRDKDRLAARALLDSVWSSENAETRLILLQSYSTPPLPEDEEWLEGKLTDRSAPVRRAVVDLLALLPGSQLVERMKARLAGRLRLGRTIEIVPLESLDESMLRDGIEPRPPAGAAMGERAWWTMQAISLLPLDHWVASFGKTPAELLELARQSSWAALLLSAWRSAVLRTPHAEWAESMAADPSLLAQLAPFLSNEARERVLSRFLALDPAAWRSTKLFAFPWSPAFTTNFLHAILRAEAQQMFPPGMLFSALREAAAWAAPDTSLNFGHPLLREFAETLDFRRQMRDALLRS